MANLAKRAFNRVRLAMGKEPVYMTGAALETDVRYRNAWDTEFKSEIIDLSAEALSRKDPRGQFWLMSGIVRRTGQQVLKNRTVTYDRMVECLADMEILTARKAGLTGTDAEIKQQRLKVVGPTNVLRFT